MAETKHALLSASSAHRWLNCTAAPHFEQNFPEGTSVYAEEGTLAHEFCEIAAMYNFNLITKRTRNSRFKKLSEGNELYNEEMLRTAEFYAEYLHRKALEFPAKPYTSFEVRVDFSDIVPDGFGTCDCVMIGGDTLHITDYKHGKGVPVSAENNPQMRLYALGALNKYSAVFGASIKKVSMAIVQPRITEDISEDVLAVEELREWGRNIEPIAAKAYSGLGTFCAGSWCRFCRGKAQCRARSENFTALEDFKDCVIAGKMTEEEALAYQSMHQSGVEGPDILTDADVADLLIRGAELVSWYNDLKDYALSAVLNGQDIPGWKAVAGKSNRAFTSEEAAFAAIRDAGYGDEQLYEKKAKTLSALEKMIGVKKFAEIAGKYITKPVGKPTLVPVSDKREPYSPAAADFMGATQR